MSSLNLRRFSDVGTLRKIHIEYLINLLEATGGAYVTTRVDLVRDKDEFDYEALAALLQSPEDEFPVELADALHYINDLSTTEGMDELLTAAEEKKIELDIGDEPSPADMALQMWLKDRNVLEELHAEHQLFRARSFEYSIGKTKGTTEFKPPSATTIMAMEAAMDSWFVKKKRGPHSRVFVFPKDGEVWFSVRHGEPMDRRGVIKEGESKTALDRPEKFDVVVYNTHRDEMRINAASKGEKALYLLEFGRHLFGNKDYFAMNGKYTLEPLRTLGEDSLACDDIPGIEWIKLREVHYLLGGSHKEIEVRKATDFFAALKGRSGSFPQRAPIFKAKFEVKFVNSKTTRSVTVTTPDRAQYSRDEDSIAVELWLGERGFSLNGSDDDEDDA